MRKTSPYLLLALLAGLLYSHGQLAAQQINLLAIRVDFVTDSLTTTFGDGSFNSGFESDSTDYVYPFDRTPHDSLYFADHLQFLGFYYNRVSGGDVTLSYDVYPAGANAAYHLPHPMWHYNYNNPDMLDRQLVELFRDAVLACAQDSTIAFSEYDRLFIFHAGTGQDFGPDLTPFDIPSAYIFPDDLQLLADDQPEYAAGIPVWDGTLISEAAILPEAEHQEEIAHGLAGTIVLQFGHAIGLPNLYNSETGRTAIGKWGLMDQGSANFRGLIPALPSAWTRLHKGWGTAEELVHDAESLMVRSIGTVSDASEIYRLRIGEGESFLVENRIRDRSGDGFTWGVDSAGDTIYFHEDYTVSFSGDTTGVIVEIEDLDFDIPGSGLLIWHLDESRLTPQHIADNSINDDPDRRGVDLEEGDGVQDLGHSYSSFHPRGGAANGNFYDAWCDTNEAFLYVNRQLEAVEFSDRSIPDSRTNDGYATDVAFFDFSNPDTLMSFSFSRSGRLPGYPLDCGDSLLTESATLLAQEDHDLLLLLTQGGWLAGFSSTQVDLYPDPVGGNFGAVPLSDNVGLRALAVSGDQLAILKAIDDDFLQLRVYSWELDPATGEFSVDLSWTQPLETTYNSVMATAEGWLIRGGCQAALVYSSGREERTLPGTLLQGGIFNGSPWLMVENEGLYQLQQDEWILFYEYNCTTDTPAPVSALLNGMNDDTPSLLLAAENQLLCFQSDGSLRWQQYRPGLTELAFGDLDADGVLELTAADEQSVYLINPEGVLLGQRSFSGADQLRLFPTAIGNNGLYLVGEREIQGWDYDGGWGPVSGYPRTMPAGASDLLYSEAGRYYLLSDTEISGYSAPTGSGPFWTQRGGSCRHDFQLPEASPHSSPTSAELIEGQVYSWPNPSRQSEPIHLVYTTGRAATIEITIFDRTGRIITTFSDSVNGWSSSETLWDVTSVASGVYYAHLEADFAGGGCSSEILKLAVIK